MEFPAMQRVCREIVCKNVLHDHCYTSLLEDECERKNKQQPTVCSMVHNFYKTQKENKCLPVVQIATKVSTSLPTTVYSQDETASAVATNAIAMMMANEPKPLSVAEPQNAFHNSRTRSGQYANNFAAMLESEEHFKQNFHMTPSDFFEILNMLQADLEPRGSNVWPNVGAEEKLAAVLELFANRVSMEYIALLYNFDSNVYKSIVDEVCNAIEKHLSTWVMPQLNEKCLTETATGFYAKCKMPNVLGVITCKSFNMQAQKLTAIAVVDASLRFTYLHMDLGNIKDTSYAIFNRCALANKLRSNQLQTPLSSNNNKSPFYFIVNETFPLKKYFMKPVKKPAKHITKEEQVFNEHIQRVSCVAESAYRQLYAKWKVLDGNIGNEPKRAQKIVTACILLYNFLKMKQNKPKCANSKAFAYLPALNAMDGNQRQIGIQTQNQLIEYCNSNKRKKLAFHT